MTRRRISEDEASLWAHAMRDVRPIKRKAAKPANPETREPLRKAATAAKETGPSARVNLPVAPRRTPAKPPGAFDAGDPKLDDKARRGRLVVERTIDLHGLTQDVARRRLQAFIETAASDGVRLVLVVTGKGGTGKGATGKSGTGRGADEADPMGPRRGIIRARFFDWVEEAALRPLIARAAPAGPRHGGAGAFYVFLKRARRARA